MGGEDIDKVLAFKPRLTVLECAAAPEADRPTAAPDPLEHLTAFCERLEQGLQYMTKVVVAMDVRLRRLELAQNRTEREKAKPVILNAIGEKAR